MTRSGVGYSGRGVTGRKDGCLEQSFELLLCPEGDVCVRSG